MGDERRDTATIITEIGSVKLAVAQEVAGVREEVSSVRESVARIEATCEPCRENVSSLTRNGREHSTRLTKLEQSSRLAIYVAVTIVTLISAVTATFISHLL